MRNQELKQLYLNLLNGLEVIDHKLLSVLGEPELYYFEVASPTSITNRNFYIILKAAK